MMDVSRHKSVDTLRGYVRDAELFKDHAGIGLLLSFNSASSFEYLWNMAIRLLVNSAVTKERPSRRKPVGESKCKM